MAHQTHGERGNETAPAAHKSELTTLDGVITALYESVSFPPGRQPDYGRLRTLFHPDARIVPPRTEKGSGLEVLDLDSFITSSAEHVVTSGLERLGFHEREVARRTSAFGTMVHLFSTYESRHTVNDPAPFQRGINSIQLVKDAHRFWVLSILWEAEGPGNPIPRAFLI